MQELRQSSEIKVRVGSAVDFEDGVSPEAGLTLGAADQAELLKHNGAATVDISGNTFVAVTAVDGWYDLTLTAGNTDTLGQLTVVIQDSSLMAPIFRDFMVLTANVWDSKYSTDKLQVDTVEVAGTSQTANDNGADLNTLLTRLSAARAEYLDYLSEGGVALASDIVSDIVLESGLYAVDSQTELGLSSGSTQSDTYNDMVIIIYDTSENKSSRRIITDYGGATKMAILDSAPDFTVTTDDTVKIFEPSDFGDVPTVAEIVNEWETQSQADPTGFHVNVKEVNGTPQTANDNSADINSILSDTGELQGDWVNGGRLDLILDIIAADTTTDIPALIAALENISSANVTTACTSSLNTYDPPTRAEATTDKDAIITEVNANETKIDTMQGNVTDILTDTAEIGTGGAGLSDLGGMSTGMKAEVESEANDALVAQKLDHLVAVADADDVVDNAIIAKLAAKGATADWSTFVNTTDSQEAIRDKQTDIETDTGEIGAAGAGLTALGDTRIANLDTTVSSRLAPAGTLATVTNLTNAPTNGDLTATMKSSIETEVGDALKVDTIPDSYATDGNQPTIAQSLLAIHQMMQEKSITGTTLTVKKPDGSTSAMTFTLDSATTPTSITRAT